MKNGSSSNLGGVFSFQGTISRRDFFSWGFALFVIKYNLDRILAGMLLDERWYPFSYLDLPVANTAAGLTTSEIRFLLALAVISAPFA